MNIKSVINNSFKNLLGIENYSTSEPKVGRKFMDSDLRRKLIAAEVEQTRRDINELIWARECYKNTVEPDTHWLIQLLDNIQENDPHIQAVIDKRIKTVTNKQIQIINSQNDVVEDKTKEFNKKSVLFDFLTAELEVKFWGYSCVIAFKDNVSGLPAIADIPRDYISPKKQRIYQDFRQQNGGAYFDIFEGPYKDLLFYNEIKRGQLLGILNQIAPYAIYKRHSWMNWDTFEELFSFPMRIGKYNIGDVETKILLEEALENMGTAPYAIIPEKSSVEIVEATKQDAYNVFDKKIVAIDNQISTLVLGGTATVKENSFVGSSEIQQTSFDELIADDIKDLTNLVNERAKPYLKMLGIDIGEGNEFQFSDKQLTPSEKMESIDSYFLSNPNYRPTKKYLESKYDTELEEVSTIKEEIEKKSPEDNLKALRELRAIKKKRTI